MALGENIKAWRTRKGWSTHELGLAADVPQSSISRFERNVQRPRQATLERIAQVLGAELPQLEYGSTDLEVVPIGKRRIPVLSYAQAGLWMDPDNDVISDDEIAEYLITDAEYSPKSFAMIVRGESMVPAFLPGDRIVVDPTVKPRPGDFVIAMNGSSEVIFKQLAELGLNERGEMVRELRSLNPVYPSWNSTSVHFRIIGTVVETSRRLREKHIS
jgi:SOS-response transcriptional repressor LexA